MDDLQKYDDQAAAESRLRFGATAYAYGRFDANPCAPYVLPVHFARRVLDEQTTVGGFRELYNQMLADRTAATA